MRRISPCIPISSSSRRRLARCLVGTPINDVERDLVLATLASNQGNRTASAHLLGVSVRTLRNKITEYSAEGLDIPRHQSRDEILSRIGSPDKSSAGVINGWGSAMTKENKTAEELSEMIISTPGERGIRP